MPISECDGCPEAHWKDVLDILTDAIKAADMDAKLVSVERHVGLIPKNIVDNLYHNPIVVIDVSGRNANVMFELGMRLAFDKPVVVVKDDVTEFVFDTSTIDHLTYPRDLRFPRMVVFKEQLRDRVKATNDRYQKDPENFPTYLKSFGTFTITKLDTKEITEPNALVLKELQEVKEAIRTMTQAQPNWTQQQRPERSLLELLGLRESDSRVLTMVNVIAQWCSSNGFTTGDVHRPDVRHALWQHVLAVLRLPDNQSTNRDFRTALTTYVRAAEG